MYWNCDAPSYTNIADMEGAFQKDIATKTTTPDNFQYGKCSLMFVNSAFTICISFGAN